MTGPSDPGLAGERTSLAWFRLGLALLAVPSGVLAYYRDSNVVAVVAAALAAVLGLLVVVRSLRHPRVPPGSLATGSIPPPATQVTLTASSVLMLALAAAVLVLH